MSVTALRHKINKHKYSNTIIFSSLVLISFCIRLYYFYQIKDSIWVTHPIVDSINYDSWAKAIISGNILGQGVFQHSPLYPFFVSLFYGLLKPLPVFVLFVQFVLGSFASGLLFLLGQRVVSRPVGFAAGLIQLGYGMAIFYESTLLSATLIHLINILLLLAVYKAVDKNTKLSWLGAGLLLGLAVIGRPTIIPFLLIAIIWMWLIWKRKQDLKKLIINSVILFLGMTIFIIPVMGRNAIVLNEFLLSVGTGGTNFYLGNRIGSPGYFKSVGDLGLHSDNQTEFFKKQAEKQLQRKITYGQSSYFWAGQAIKQIIENPSAWIKLLFRKSLLFINHYELTTSLNYYWVKNTEPFLRFPWLTFSLVWALGFAGMVLTVRQWKLLLPLFGMIFIYAFSNISIFVASQYRFGMLPALFIFSGVSIDRLIKFLTQRQWKKACLLMAVFTFCLAVSQINILTKDERNEHLSAHYINIGIQYMNSDQFPEAITNFQMGCKLAPHCNWNQTRLSEAYFKNKEYDKALSIMSKVYPKHPHIEEVAGLYADLLAIKGKYSDAHYVLGATLQMNGRLDKAIEHYTEALRSDPNYAAVHNNLGVIFKLKGNAERAANHFRKALQISPDLAAAKNSLDALLEKEKDKPL